jgi:hypothetical protein
LPRNSAVGNLKSKEFETMKRKNDGKRKFKQITQNNPATDRERVCKN